jgi:hypothetical protein
MLAHFQVYELKGVLCLYYTQQAILQLYLVHQIQTNKRSNSTSFSKRFSTVVGSIVIVTRKSSMRVEMWNLPSTSEKV